MTYYLRNEWQKHLGHKIYVILYKSSKVDGTEGFSGRGELVSEIKDLTFRPTEQMYEEIDHKTFENVLEEAKKAPVR